MLIIIQQQHQQQQQQFQHVKTNHIQFQQFLQSLESPLKSMDYQAKLIDQILKRLIKQAKSVSV